MLVIIVQRWPAQISKNNSETPVYELNFKGERAKGNTVFQQYSRSN